MSYLGTDIGDRRFSDHFELVDCPRRIRRNAIESWLLGERRRMIDGCLRHSRSRRFTAFRYHNCGVCGARPLLPFIHHRLRVDSFQSRDAHTSQLFRDYIRASAKLHSLRRYFTPISYSIGNSNMSNCFNSH